MAETTTTFTVAGATSESDRRRITDELEGFDGIMAADVDSRSGAVEVRIDVDLFAAERARLVLEELGYEVEQEA